MLNTHYNFLKKKLKNINGQDKDTQFMLKNKGPDFAALLMGYSNTTLTLTLTG